MGETPAYPAPRPTAESAPFWDAAREDRLVLQYCPSCARWQFYPRPFCTACLSEDLQWRQSDGRGRIHSFTVCHVPSHPAFADRVPYVMALVDLDEGVRMLGEITGGAARIGAAVSVEFEHREDGVSLPRFRLLGDGQ